ncbi:MAG TPA: helix-turn-helix domain-containing protein [Azospirillaceae bacterium]|nr:helix-turn-helix domain-containing protein [Azospirillaceae bacterium]
MGSVRRDWRDDAVLRVVTLALAAGKGCPTNAELAASIGAGSVSVPSMIMRRLEQEGRLIVERSRCGRRVYLPGSPDAPQTKAQEPRWRGRGLDPAGLRARRRALGLSREELARRAGISLSALDAAEGGRPGGGEATRGRVLQVLEAAERRRRDAGDDAGRAGGKPADTAPPPPASILLLRPGLRPSRRVPFVDPPQPERDVLLARLRSMAHAPGPFRTCQYIHGEASGRKFCGKPSRPGSSYCERHHARCHVPAGPVPEPPPDLSLARAPARLLPRRGRPAV